MRNERFSTFEKYFWPMKQNQFRFKTQEKGLSISCKVLRCFKSLQNRFEIFQLMVDANLEPILNTITNTYLDINRFKYFSKSYSLNSNRFQKYTVPRDSRQFDLQIAEKRQNSNKKPLEYQISLNLRTVNHSEMIFSNDVGLQTASLSSIIFNFVK